jgi:hypothetical protein
VWRIIAFVYFAAIRFLITPLLFNQHWPAQSPRVGFVLFLDKKNQKSSHQEGFFARCPAHYPPLAFALQTRQNHGLLNFAPLHSLISPASAKSSYAPLTLLATIVLPAFTQSFPADGHIYIITFVSKYSVLKRKIS